MDDLYSLLTGDDAQAAAQKAQAMADALRQRRTVGTILATLGDKHISDVGQGILGATQQDETQLGRVPMERQQMLGQRLSQALQQRQIRKSDEAEADMQNPTAGQVFVSALNKFGMPVDPNTPTSVMERVLPVAEKAYGVDENAKLRAALARAAGERRDLNVSTKEEQFNAKREDSAVKQLTQLLDPYANKGGLRSYMDVINRVKQIEGQVIDPATGQLKAQLDPRQMAELGITLQQAVANGHASQAEVEKLIPHTAGGSMASALEYVTGHPWDTNQRAMAEKMLHSARNAGDIAANAVHEAVRSRIPGPLGLLRQIGSKRGDAMLTANGMNPEAFDDQGLVKPGMEWLAAAQAAAAPGGSVPANKMRIRNIKTGKTAVGPKGPVPAGWEIVP